MSAVSDLIGNELTNALTSHQYEIVRGAADEAPDGLRKVADEIRAAGANIERPVAVLLNRIHRGQHADRQRDTERASVGEKRPPALEAAMRLYAAKLVELERHTAGELTARQRQESAIDYAVSEAPRMSLPLPAGQTMLDVEQELRRRVDATNTRPPETEEQAFERRRLMGRGWKLINECLHDSKIAAMHRALRAGCVDPDDPTDDEAANVRLALLEEIALNGVQPRVVFAPPSVDGLVPIGQALGVSHDDDEDLPW